MRDENRRAASRCRQNAFENLCLAANVELRGGLVQQYHAGAEPHGTQRASQRHPLPLTARQVGAALVTASEHRVETGELAGLDTVLARGYEGGTDLSGGQWQRVALARALCAVRLGAGVVLLDEPTAQLDVRGEAEIFERILTATRRCTTILISHRFSTVRHADRICVLEHGKVVELGTHDELMVQGGRYRTMFELQAQRFGATEDEEGAAYDVLA